MATRQRWLSAQQYEKNFWAKLASNIEAGTRNQLDWYQWKASEVEKRLARCTNNWKNERGRVLEIGSGPIGIVNFLEWGQRFAIDPLEDFYRASPTLSKLRKPGVTYVGGTGEHLPYPDSFFSLVIIDNVIDHTCQPERVLQEINRVLENNGLLYLAVNIRTTWGTLLHKLLAASRIDAGHPHSYTKEAIGHLLVRYRFTIRQEQTADYRHTIRRHRSSRRLKEKIKGFMGISEYEYCSICRKSDDADPDRR